MKTLAALLCLVLLGGCSGLRLVESQVQSLPAGGFSPEPEARFRFERLPSQQAQANTEAIEAMAEAEFKKAGLLRDDANARYSVLLSTRVQSYRVDDWGRPYGGTRIGGSLMIGSGGFYGAGIGMRFPPPSQYRYEVTVLLRDLRTGQIVYETSATHEGPWSDSANLLPAVLAAALQGFPRPPAGARRVPVEIPR